ncbi:unnamed protein product, partial [Chrysoparadoxa australica]
GGGRGRGGREGGYDDMGPTSCSGAMSGSAYDLENILRRIDGKPYGAYHDIEGTFGFGTGSQPRFELLVDKVQADPFAAPSRCHILIPGGVAGFPRESMSTKARRVALCDFITRAFCHSARKMGADQRTERGGWHGVKGGEITMDEPGQHILERTSVLVGSDGSVEARFTIALPARGRSICGGWAAEVLVQKLPQLVKKSLIFESLNADALRHHILSVEDQITLRGALKGAGLVAFVGNGSILPRQRGDNDLPMSREEAIPFQSPPSLERSFSLPNCGEVKGMGIPPGVSLIVGGGFHGKSTLLQALEVGVYNHIPGDGREFVCIDDSAVKVRAEDGRCVTGVNISPFISNLPFGKGTSNFSTPDASGSTSQATNIIEALECGSTALLV